MRFFDRVPSVYSGSLLRAAISMTVSSAFFHSELFRYLAAATM